MTLTPHCWHSSAALPENSRAHTAIARPVATHTGRVSLKLPSITSCQISHPHPHPHSRYTVKRLCDRGLTQSHLVCVGHAVHHFLDVDLELSCLLHLQHNVTPTQQLTLNIHLQHSTAQHSTAQHSTQHTSKQTRVSTGSTHRALAWKSEAAAAARGRGGAFSFCLVDPEQGPLQVPHRRSEAGGQ